MIFSFNKEIDDIIAALDLSEDLSADISRNSGMKLAMILVGVLDRGMGMERDRCIRIVQKLSLNAMDVTKEIRKPLR